MALVQKQDNRRNLTLLVVFVAIVIGGLTYFWLNSRSSESSLINTDVSRTDLPIISSFGQDVFITEQFTMLQDFLADQPADQPAPVGNDGNGQPFTNDQTSGQVVTDNSSSPVAPDTSVGGNPEPFRNQ